MLVMVVDVMTQIAELSIESINFGQEAVFHRFHPVDQRIKCHCHLRRGGINCVVLPKKDSSDIRLGCVYGLVECVSGISSLFTRRVVSPWGEIVGVGEGAEALPCH